MGFMDRITEIIAGRSWTEQSEIRRLEKKYAGVKQSLSELKVVSFESPADFPPDRKAALSHPASLYRANSLSPSIPHPGSLRRGRPQLERSQSEIPPEPKPAILPSPSGPPCITAIDLSPEQLERTYSHDNVWDSTKSRLPPLSNLTGFGAYRRAFDASIEWEVHYLQRRHHGCHSGIVADKLDELPLGIRPQALAIYREDNDICNKFLGSFGKTSEPDDLLMEEQVDSLTGELISTGFIPSRESSAASCFKDLWMYTRNDSSASITSVNGDVYCLPNKPPRRRSGLKGSGSGAAIPLDTVDEDNSRIFKPSPGRKIVKPCAFDDSINQQSASVFDDSGDESDGGDEWQDIKSQVNRAQNASLLTQKLNAVKLAAEGLKVGIDRSKATKAPMRPAQRRTNSRTVQIMNAKRFAANEQASVQRLASEQTLVRRPTMRTLKSYPKPKDSGIDMENDKSSGNSMTCVSVGNASQEHAAIPEVNSAIEILDLTLEPGETDRKCNKQNNKEEEVTKNDFKSTAFKLGPNFPDEAADGAVRKRRDRSGTAIHILPGNPDQVSYGFLDTGPPMKHVL